MKRLRIKDWIAFTEWIGHNHVFLNGVWVHKYANQLDKNNWKTTEELLNLYIKQL